MAIITSMTGTTVHSVALSTDSHTTCAATAEAEATGRSTANCAMHSTQVATEGSQAHQTHRTQALDQPRRQNRYKA